MKIVEKLSREVNYSKNGGSEKSIPNPEVSGVNANFIQRVMKFLLG